MIKVQKLIEIMFDKDNGDSECTLVNEGEDEGCKAREEKKSGK